MPTGAALQPFATRILEAFAHSEQVVIGVVDLEGHILAGNRGLAAIAGRPIEALLGVPLWDSLVRPEDADMVRGVLASLGQGAPAMSAENPWRRHDGTALPMRWFNVPLHDEAGVVRWVLGFGYDATWHHRLRERAEEAEYRFQLLEEAVEEVFYIADRMAERLQYASPGFEYLWEHPISALMANARLFLERVHADDLPLVYRTLERQLTGVRTEMEYRLCFPDGRIRWIRDRAYPIADGSGVVQTIVGVASDVTVHREALDRLADREQLLSAVFRGSSHALWLLSPAGELLESNPVAEALVAAAPPTRFSDLPWATEGDRATVTALLQAPLAGARTRRDVRLATGGELLVLDLTVQAVESPAGAVRYLLAEALDITERVAARRARDEAEERLALAIEATSEGVWDWNLHDDSAFFSPRWCRNLGYAPELVQPTIAMWCALVHPDDRAAVARALEAVRSGTTDHFRLELRLRTHDAGWFWSLSRGRVVAHDAAGRPSRVVGTDTDIGPLKQVEGDIRSLNESLEVRVRERTEALEAASRAKDEFLAVISHELRTPLMAVLGVAESVEDGVYGPVTLAQQEALQLVTSSGHHLLSLIGDLLDLSKLAVNRLEVRFVPVAVLTLIQEVLPIAERLALPRGQTITVQQPMEPLGELEVDATRLRQVLLNLLENAIKFAPEGTTIELSTTATDRVVTFAVCDAGPGVREADLPRLFRPFEQLDMQLARRYGGLGLGLALVHRLTAQHRGRVEVWSAEGAGSRFAITLPRTQALPPVAPAARGRLLLVAEVDVAQARLERWLGEAGFEVITATDVGEAIRRAAVQAPDVLLIDGDATPLELLGYEALRTLPVVLMLTVVTAGWRRALAAAFGADAIVEAPLEAEGLLAVMEARRRGGRVALRARQGGGAELR